MRVETTERPDFDVVLVLDISGSMAGAPSKAVFQAALTLYDILEDGDTITILLFNTACVEVLPSTKKKNIKKKGGLVASIPKEFLTTAKDAFACSLCTALWDAINFGLTKVATRIVRGNSHPHMVVLTDGENTERGVNTEASCTEALRTPGDVIAKGLLHQKNGAAFSNFHCTCISVGEAAATNFENMGKSNLHHVKAKDASEIENSFRAVKSFIDVIRKTTRKIETKVSETVTFIPVGGGAPMTAVGGTIKKGQSDHHHSKSAHSDHHHSKAAHHPPHLHTCQSCGAGFTERPHLQDHLNAHPQCKRRKSG